MYAAAVAASLPIWPFGWHLALHVLGAVMLVGNALVMAVWLTLVGFVGSDQAKRQAARVVNRGDAWFTVPGAMLLLLNGLAMVAARYGGVMGLATTGWITIGFILLGVSGLIWTSRLLLAQLALYRLAQAAGPRDAGTFRATLNRWYRWCVMATVLPLLAVFVMTTKPVHGRMRQAEAVGGRLLRPGDQHGRDATDLMVGGPLGCSRSAQVWRVTPHATFASIGAMPRPVPWDWRPSALL